MRRWWLLVVAVAVAAGAFLALRRTGPSPRPVPPGPRQLWVFEAPRPGSVLAAPTVTPDTVYLAVVHVAGFQRSGAVYAIDRITGKPRWVFDRDGNMLPTASTPAVSAGRLFLGEGMHADFVCRLQCLDAASGKPLWGRDVGGHIEGGPTVSGGIVIFPAGDDGVHAADAETGAFAWNFRGDLHIDSTPCVADGRVYVGSGKSRRFDTHQVVCLDAATGKPLWRTPVNLPAWGSPVVAGGRVYLGLGNGRLTESARPPERPAGALACLNAKSGELLWTFPTGDAVFGTPTLVGERAIIGSRDGNVYGITPEGREAFRVAAGSPVVAGIAAAERHVFAVSESGRVICLDPAGGREVWRHALDRTGPAVALATPAIAENRLYVAAELTRADTGIVSLFCFELPTDTGEGR